MTSNNRKYPFFQNLRTVAASVSNDVKEVERKMQKCKFELPENNAMFRLIETCDDLNTYKSDSQAFLQQLHEDNEKYRCYRQDVEPLVDEMESSLDRVEELLSGYGYQKYCSDELLNANSETPSKETLPSVSLQTKEEQSSALQKTPVLANYGLTAKFPKYLPSALKDAQGSVVKSVKKQVQFESPERLPDVKGKENRGPYSLQKTPLLEDYGISSRKKKHIPNVKNSSHIVRQLNFQSTQGSASKDVTYIADEEDTNDLLCSLNSVLENINVGEPESDVKLSTPEEPFVPYNERIRFANERENDTVTPEEPKLLPIRSLGASKIDTEPSTPRTPELEPMSLSLENWLQSEKKTEPSTPKTPEFEPTSMSFKNWLQSEKEKRL